MAKYYYKADNRQVSSILRKLGFACIGAGLLLFAYFFAPVVAYKFFITDTSASEIESPIPKYLVGKNTSVKGLLEQGLSRLQFDYTDARNWYPQVHAEEEKKPQKVDQYLLSISKLGIENAQVSTVDYDLSKNLVHYYGPENPIERGTSVIFGHSTLPQLFDPTNYKAIFATVHTLQVGDEFSITVEGQSYTYQIFDISITTPEDINIFAQSTDNSYITLVTCTPPGTIWKRLVLRAVLKA